MLWENCSSSKTYEPSKALGGPSEYMIHIIHHAPSIIRYTDRSQMTDHSNRNLVYWIEELRHIFWCIWWLSMKHIHGHGTPLTRGCGISCKSKTHGHDNITISVLIHSYAYCTSQLIVARIYFFIRSKKENKTLEI